MWMEIFGLVGIYSVFRYIMAGPAFKDEVEATQQWDDLNVDARQIDHDIAVFAKPDDKHPDHIGALRSLQEKRNMVRATEARPMLDQFYITRDNARKLEVIIE